MTDERILNKIKKCLALSQSSEPAEAAAAMRQAQKLMEIHGISMGDVGRADIGEGEIRSKASVSRVKDWELHLLNTVAKAFGCQLVWRASRSWMRGEEVYGCYVMIGLKQQVEVALYTADVMGRKLIKARNKFVADLTASERGWANSRKYKVQAANSFCLGWVESINKTVSTFANPEGVDQFIADAKQEMTNGKVAKTQSSKIQMNALIQGAKVGKDESIYRPMETKSPTLRIA